MTIYYIFKFLRIWAVFASATLLFSIFVCLTGSNIFKRAGKRGYYALVPMYNLLELLDIVKLSRYYFILLLLPVVNVLIIYMILYRLSIVFNTSKLFALGLIVFPYMFLPVLNFSKMSKIEEKTDDVSGEMIGLLTENQINELNKEEDNEPKVDNVFKTESKIAEDVPKFKAKTIKYKEMMLEKEKIEKIEKVKPIKVEEIKENKFVKRQDKLEDDNIEIVEL